MSGDDEVAARVPDGIQRVLDRFRSMTRDEKMQALVQYSRKLEPVPQRYADIDRSAYTVPECQTRVDLFPEFRDGNMHFYADVNARQSPTVAAVLAVIFSAVNDRPPSVTLAIPKRLRADADGRDGPSCTRDGTQRDGDAPQARRERRCGYCAVAAASDSPGLRPAIRSLAALSS